MSRYIGGFISRLATLGTRWDMHASRKILLRHFDARATEYRHEISSGKLTEDQQADHDTAQEPVSEVPFYLKREAH